MGSRQIGQEAIGVAEYLLPAQGWDPANGWPTRRKLEELGLADVADELARMGRLG